MARPLPNQPSTEREDTMPNSRRRYFRPREPPELSTNALFRHLEWC